MSTQTFSEIRRIFGWIWLFIGAIGVIGLLALSSKAEVSTENANIQIDFLHGLCIGTFFLYLVSSVGNKILRVIRRISPTMLVVAIVSPVFWAVFESLSASKQALDISISLDASTNNLAFWGLIFLIWLGGWWISDVIDLGRYWYNKSQD
jgi:hypothetical protein